MGKGADSHTADTTSTTDGFIGGVLGSLIPDSSACLVHTLKPNFCNFYLRYRGGD